MVGKKTLNPEAYSEAPDESEGQGRLEADQLSKVVNRIQTKRHTIFYQENEQGGPAGYESTYLTGQGEPVSGKLYDLLNSQGETLPAAENRALRQRNAEILEDMIENGKRYAVVSGFKPSGPGHFGHLLTSTAVAYFQKNGAQVSMPVADVECDMDTKINKEQYMINAADNLLDWGAGGVNLDAAHVYLQSEETRVSALAYRVARQMTFDLAADIYGMDKLVKGFPFLFAGLTQVADILLPQHKDFGNDHSVMVAGPDQDGHMQMTMELARKTFEGNVDCLGASTEPSAVYIPHIRGLEGKMSSSRPESTLFIGPGPEGYDLQGRIEASIRKVEDAYNDPEKRKGVENGASDLIRYIQAFRDKSNEPAKELCETETYSKIQAVKDDSLNVYGEKAQKEIDGCLAGGCEPEGRDNVELVKDTLKDFLAEHYSKRKQILEYAVARTQYERGERAEKPEAPAFWKIPESAVVDESLRNRTQWYHIVASAAENLQP
ncbi:TPA: hypothetical protein HA265_00265 [Candidatus Woesearchaeota archaeon]|nr:hypothetical protein [Candidatus Woesearchaeota archaeon]